MASTNTPRTFSLLGKGLKFDTKADIEPFLKDVDPTSIEEIHLSGNTIGVDASLAIAEFLSKTTVLKVCFCNMLVDLTRFRRQDCSSRLPTSLTYSLDD